MHCVLFVNYHSVNIRLQDPGYHYKAVFRYYPLERAPKTNSLLFVVDNIYLRKSVFKILFAPIYYATSCERFYITYKLSLVSVCNMYMAVAHVHIVYIRTRCQQWHG